MKPRSIEVATYVVVGAGCSVLGAIVIGIITQINLANQPTKLAKFEGNFWSLTVPCLTIVGGLSTGMAHSIVTRLRTSFLQSFEPDQPPTNPPTNYSPVTNQPTNQLPSLPVVELERSTNQPAPNGDENRKTDLKALIGGLGGRADFGG